MEKKDYYETCCQVKGMLEEQIGKNTEGAHIETNYFYKKRNAGRAFTFDLVVLDNRNDLKKVYEFSTPSECKEKLDAIIKELKLYREETNAEVFIAFVDDNKALKVLSLQQLEEKSKKDPSLSYTVESFSSFYEIINNMQNGKESDTKLFFRGHNNNKFTIEPLPSIYRYDNIEKEDILYHEAIRRIPAEFSEDMTTFDKLVGMQDYGLPTRLLEVTTNPLVALFFSCQKDISDADGCVLVYSMSHDQIQYFDSEPVNILANLAKLPIDFDFEKQKQLLVNNINNGKKTIDINTIKAEDIHKVLCVLPKLSNNRTISQQGAFFIFGMGKKKDEPAEITHLPYIINIKAGAKRKILQELDLLGINVASLIPEPDKIMYQIHRDFFGS